MLGKIPVLFSVIPAMLVLAHPWLPGVMPWLHQMEVHLTVYCVHSTVVGCFENVCHRMLSTLELGLPRSIDMHTCYI